MRPFGEQLPKPFLPVLGIPCIQYAVDLLAAAGARKIIINTHHSAEIAQAAIRNLVPGRSELTISDERALLLGSGGGIRQAFEHTRDEDLLVCNADTIFPANIPALWAVHREQAKKSSGALTFCLRKNGGDQEKYREFLVDEKTSRVSSLGNLEPHGLHSTGWLIVNRNAAAHLSAGAPADFVEDILRSAVSESRVFFREDTAFWFDIGSPKLWRDAHFRLMEEMERSAPLPSAWERRIREQNEIIAPGIWKKNGGLNLVKESGENLSSPVYWGGSSAFPQRLGPNLVHYGDWKPEWVSRNAISFDGRQWKEDRSQ